MNVNTNMNIPLVPGVLRVLIFLQAPPISVDVAQLHMVVKKRGVSQRRRKVEMGGLPQIACKALFALMAWVMQSILGSVDLGNLCACSVDALVRGGGGGRERGRTQQLSTSH